MTTAWPRRRQRREDADDDPVHPPLAFCRRGVAGRALGRARCRGGRAREAIARGFRLARQICRRECGAQGVGQTGGGRLHGRFDRSEEHTSELQSLMRISYAVFCLKKKNTKTTTEKRDT